MSKSQKKSKLDQERERTIGKVFTIQMFASNSPSTMHSFEVQVIVQEVRSIFGAFDYKVTPVSGRGSVWVRSILETQEPISF